MKSNKTAEQIEAQLEQKTNQMGIHQEKGNYVDAETCRLNVEQLKKDFEIQRLYELEQNQKREREDLARTHQQELDNFNKFWDKKLDDFYADGQRMEGEMSQRHQDQIQKMRDKLDEQLPKKLKESSELLNLRKMEQHMAKQKNYVEAQKVQQRCHILEKEQAQAWFLSRNLKIQTAINTLIHKQEHELMVLQKKNKTGMDERMKQRKVEEKKMEQKYNNTCNELRMQHEKQIICHKGHFKSKGGQATARTMSKSKGFK